MEYPQHNKGKYRVAGILLARPEQFQNVHVEYDTGIYVPTTLGPKPYIADVYSEAIIMITAHSAHCHHLKGVCVSMPLVQKLVVEIDGKKGHSGRIAYFKDIRRDEILKEHGVATCRFPTKWVHGRKAVSDDDIIAQILWALKQR